MAKKIVFEVGFIAVAFIIVMAICVTLNVPESFRHGLAFGMGLNFYSRIKAIKRGDV